MDIRKHIQENKDLYMVGLTLVNVVIGLSGRKLPQINIDNHNNVNPTINQVVSTGSYSRKIVKCIETGEIFESITEAAIHADVSINNMSRHLHGKADSINGKHYEIVAVTDNPRF